MNNYYKYTKDYSKLTCLAIPVINLLFLLWFSPVRADNVITSGATMRIGSGTIVTTAQNIVVENGGSITIDGSLILKNCFNNQNTIDTLGSGTIEFSGTIPQSLSGQNTIGSMVVNNAAGLDIAGNTIIDTLLNLQSGHIRLGSSNLTLGDKASISGSPSASAMVIATGTAELRKSFSTTGSFTFPLGDNTGTAEYSPVSINFTSGIFTPENYVGVKLANSAYPGLSGNYLNRYWIVNQNGITSPVYDILFQYLPADIVGTESEINCIKVEPLLAITYNQANTVLHQLTANGATTFGTYVGANLGVPENLPLTNLTIGNEVTDCYNATQTITVAGGGTTVNFEHGSTATLIAGQSIRFLPGFHAQNGSWMDAHITTNGTFCGVASSSIVQQPQPEKSAALYQVSIPEQGFDKEKSVKVYPNPNNGRFTVELTNFENASVTIYSITGIKIMQQQVINPDVLPMNLPNLTKGIYFLTVNDDEKQIVKKFIVD